MARHRVVHTFTVLAVALAAAACDLFTSPKGVSNSVGPTLVAGGHTFTSLVAGDSHTCGLTAAGQAYCWGYNSTHNAAGMGDIPTGQLGDSSALDRATPVPVAGGHTFTMLTAGAYHTCGLTAAGAAFCWGANRNEVSATPTTTVPTGQLGDGTAQHQYAPVPVAGGLTFSSISAGYFHACALTAGGAAYCWGSAGLGVGDTVTRLTPAATTGGFAFQSIASGGTHTCALTAGGAAYCWGNNSFGQLGDGTTTFTLAPTAVTGGLVFQSIAAGGNNSCGIVAGGSVYCWGDNTLGAVGDGTTTSRAVPTKVATSEALSGVSIGSLTASLFTGSSHVCALTASGPARCWGNHNAGPLADGSFTARTVPTAVSTSFTFQSLTSGGLHSCGLVATGAAYCWGSRFVVGAP